MWARVALVALMLSGCGTTVPVAQRGAGSVARPDGVNAPSQSTATVGPAAGTIGGLPVGSAGGGTGTSIGTSTGTSPGSSTSGSRVGGGSGQQPGVRALVKVGIVYTNNDAAAAAGINNGNSFTPKAAFEALVKAYNARGGLAGRPITPTYEEVKSSSGDLAKDLQAVCANLTQDAHVEVVLTEVGAYFESFEACLSKAGIPVVSGDYALGDDQALRDDLGYLSATTPTTDTRMRTLLTEMVATKRLTSTDKLGVIVEGCPYNERTYANTVVPVAKQLGVPVADHVVAGCFGSASDLGRLSSDMANAVLRFRQNGITNVTFISGGVEGNFFLVFARAADSQAYYPHYSLTSAVAATVQEANTPKSQLANASGLGWLPTLDSSQVQPVSAAQRRCLADLRAGGLSPASSSDRFFAYSTCDSIGLYSAVLTVAHGVSSRTAVLSAAAQLGAGFVGSAAYGGASDFSHGRRAGVAQGRVFSWSASCTCFTYTGSPFAL